MSLKEGSSLPSPDFWRGRRVLVTGHTGFKGTWLTTWLTALGAEVAGLSLPEPTSDPALWDRVGLQVALDIRADVTSESWQAAVAEFDPQTVMHLAAQSLVTVGYEEPMGTFRTNVLGTASVLAALQRFTSLEAALVVTTDKVYDTSGPGPYSETAPLGGTDPYAASKAGAELVVRSWPGLTVPVATARAGNVIGGGDWGRNRLVPDLVRQWSRGAALELRRPEAVRPWQHVMEPLCGYLVYLERLSAGNEVPRAINFGPSSRQTVSVRGVAEHAAHEWMRAFDLDDLPSITVASEAHIEETGILEIDSDCATSLLGWRSTLDWREAVTLAIDWYASDLVGNDAARLMRDQLEAYAGSAAS